MTPSSVVTRHIEAEQERKVLLKRTRSTNQEGEISEADATLRSTLVSMARTAAIRYSILLPKMKGHVFFQPEDHVGQEHIHKSLKQQPGRWVGLTHTAAIFGSGALLFFVQERVLHKLEPESEGDFGRATAFYSGISGCCGGLAYSLAATSTHAWMGTGEKSLLTSMRKRDFFLRASPYTLPRDMGGFGLYFGVYSAAHRFLSEQILPSFLSGDGASSSGSDKKKEKAATPLPTATLSEHTTQALKRHSLNFDDGLTFDLLLQIATIACSGAISGLFTYAWRTPWDTLYKKSVGWRDPDAPLWSMSRFLRSPRGLKALGVGAATWSAYEVADAGIRYLAALSEDDVAPGKRDPGRTSSETSPFR